RGRVPGTGAAAGRDVGRGLAQVGVAVGSTDGQPGRVHRRRSQARRERGRQALDVAGGCGRGREARYDGRTLSREIGGRVMTLATGRAKLVETTKTLTVHWEAVREGWGDRACQEYEEEHVAPIAPQAAAAVRATDRLAAVLSQM